MSKENKQSIELSKEQFFALLKAVYLGNWMANAHRDGSAEDPIIREYEDISDFIFSQAPKFGFKEYVIHERGDGKRHYPTRYFEEGTDVDKLHDEYDKENFWDELVDILGRRDFFRHYGRERIEKMGRDERFKKLYEFIDKWEDEVGEYGIERLDIKNDK